MAHFIESVGKIEMIKNIIFDVGKVLIEVRWQEVMREMGMYAIHFQTKCEAEKELEKLGV